MEGRDRQREAVAAFLECGDFTPLSFFLAASFQKKAA
jgi:hypothetical protein